MKERVELLVREFRDARRHRLRFEAAVTALSVLVTGGVFWQLRRVGTAISEEGAPPGVPVIETDADPPDQTAEAAETAEDPADWEALLPEFTDESPQQRIAAIAVSQLGYTEGEGEVLLSDDGTSRTGYTRYGAWYGNPYGEWNTMFTYFCMYYAGIEKDRIPYGSGCWAWYETLSENGMLTPCGNEAEGDIIFFDSDADGEPDRTGIVSGTEETEDGVQIHVIAGNCEGAVAEQQYLRGGSDVVGVLSVDSYLTEPLTPSEPEIVLISYSADTESGIHVDAQAAEGVFPEGTEMIVRDADLQEVWGDAALIGPAEFMLSEKVAVDISFFDSEGRELEPADTQHVQVQISLPDSKKLSENPEKEPMLLHIEEGGAASIIEDAAVTEDSAEFEAESFSIYVVTALGEREKDHIHESLQGGYYINENRTFTDYFNGVPLGIDSNYLLYVGESVQVVGYTTGANNWMFGNNTSILDAPDGQKREPLDDGTGRYRCEAEYIALSPGTTSIRLDLDGNNNNFAEFFVKVLDNPYVPHSEELKNNTVHMKVGDSISVYKTITEAERQRLSSEFGGDGDFCWTDGSDVFCSPSFKATVDNGNGTYTVEKSYVATAAGTMYVHDRLNGSLLTVIVDAASPQFYDHADIEISDDGKYIEVETIENNNGTSVTKKTVYRSAVSKVNYCYIYDQDGTLVKTYTSDLYQANGNPGEAQYELTSKYTYFNDDDPTNRRNKKLINQASVDHVTFDVNIRLFPIEEITIESVNGVETGRRTRDISTETGKDVENVTFDLSKRDVIDAHNKCPDHTGMDFTISANMATVQLNASKKVLDFNGNELPVEEGKFRFRLIEDSGGSFTVQQISSSSDVITLPEDSDIVNEVYQAFSGTGDAVQWGSGVDGAEVLKELKSISFTGENVFASCVTAQDVYNVLMSSTNPQDSNRFRKAASEHLVTASAMKPATRFEHTLSAEPGYYLVRDVNELLDTKTNDSSGKVSFEKIIYNKPGKYRYFVSEDIENGNAMAQNNLKYDTGVIEVEVEIVEEADRSLTPYIRILNRDKLEFVNRKFSLPETGGTGPLPYLAAGTLLISAAFALPLIRRRKEDE